MWIIRYAFAAAIIIAILGFTIGNSYQRVVINIGAKTYPDVPLILALFIAFCVGIVFWFAMTVVLYFRQSAKIAEQKKKIKILSEELTALRNMPLDEPDDKIGEKV